VSVVIPFAHEKYEAVWNFDIDYCYAVMHGDCIALPLQADCDMGYLGSVLAQHSG
jgi:hypothetical protein